jgi:GNAT superfamily N-acetyltransferase
MGITIRPIIKDEIDRVPLRCWPDRQEIINLFERQGTIGMAAWENEQCVAQLHCYRIECPDDISSIWPKWNRPWWAEKLISGEIQLKFPAWCHACCHVGRTLETVHDELLSLVLRFAEEAEWNVDRLHKKLNSLDGVFLDRERLEEMVCELHDSKRRTFKTEALEYRRRGIGTALFEESIRWARHHGYATIVASAVPRDIPDAMNHAGTLPWTTFARLGFHQHYIQLVDMEHNPFLQEKESILKAEGTKDIYDRMMLLELN